MPQIKIDYVVSFSSEDPSHPASNLLSNDIVNKKWIGQEKGGASNSVVMQLEKSSHITSIRIGNHNSALIEVLVGRSEAANQPYEVILCASSFMTPSDSRNGVNESRMRTFNTDQLVAGVRDKKWDRVRIVCTQPFNKHLQFGLSFIHFFSVDTKPADEPSAPPKAVTSKPVAMLGKFKIREASSDEEESSGSSFKPGELFARLKENKISTDAQIRQAGLPQTLNDSKESNLLVKTIRPAKGDKALKGKTTDESSMSSRNDRKNIYYDDSDEDDTSSGAKISKLIQKDREEKAKIEAAKILKEKAKIEAAKILKEKAKIDAAKVQKEKAKVDKNTNATTPANKATNSGNDSYKMDTKNSFNSAKNKTDKPSGSKDVSFENSISKKRKIDDDEKRKENEKRRKNSMDQEKKPHSSKDNDISKVIKNIPRGENCLRGVVFVLSGYVNPKRATLRDTAVDLGARYSPDWSPSCTHLVCAFPNTPKHDQVRKSGSKAVVVSGSWIEECGTEEAHLPWTWYAMDAKYKTDRLSLQQFRDAVRSEDKTKKNQDDGDKRNDDEQARTSRTAADDSGEDTDDDIEKFMQQQKFNRPGTSKVKNQIVSDDSEATDIEEDIQPKNDENSPEKKTEKDVFSMETDSDSDEIKKETDGEEFTEELPDLFSGIKFYIDPKLEREKYDVSEVKRYILAYCGEIVEDWKCQDLDAAITTENLADDLREGKPKKCKLMRPEWVWKCNDTKTLYPFEKYSIP